MPCHTRLSLINLKKKQANNLKLNEMKKSRQTAGYSRRKEEIMDLASRPLTAKALFSHPGQY